MKNKVDIVYLKKEIKDGSIIPYIKEDPLGHKYVYLMNDADEIISIGRVDDLEERGRDKE